MRFSFTHKVRLILLIVGLVLFFPIAWNLSFSETYNAAKKLDKVDMQIINYESGQDKLSLLQKELKEINTKLQHFNDSVLFQEYILGEVSSICNQSSNLNIIYFSPVYTENAAFYQIKNLYIDVEGPFHQLLKLMDKIERTKKLINIVSVKFSINNDKRKQERLVLRIYFQSYIKKTI
jgi:Tfp pilus assembly protein PilO